MKNYEHFKIDPKMLAFAIACHMFGNKVIEKNLDMLIDNRFNAGIWSSVDSSFLRYNDGTIAKVIEEYWNNDNRYIEFGLKEYNYFFQYPNRAITKWGIRNNLEKWEMIYNFLINNGCHRFEEK